MLGTVAFRLHGVWIWCGLKPPGMLMELYQGDPIKDLRWSRFLENYPKACVFHTATWLKALRSTYGYKPVFFTTSPATQELKNALLFCEIQSSITGHRLVSLPFSGHCEPLCDSTEEVNFLLRNLKVELKRRHWNYLELRPLNNGWSGVFGDIGCLPEATYFSHIVDLQPELGAIFSSLDKDSVQRRIHRAQRAQLNEKCGRSDVLLRDFYALFVLTRARHKIPPMPFNWFLNLVDSLEDAIEIRLAYRNEIPISGILTLRSKDNVIYKYGCSNLKYNKYGATPWLLWRAIEAAKSRGAKTFDLGRTGQDDAGLLAFKNHWVPQPTPLVYWKFPPQPFRDSVGGWKLKAAKRVFSYMPNSLLKMTGKLIYRHIG